MGFCSQDISEFSVIPNAARGESYSFIPCRMVNLLHFQSLELWEPWNLFKEWPPRATLDALGYVHTVQDRILFCFKSCSGTVWTRINVLLRCRNCSEALPVWTEALSVIQFAMLPFDIFEKIITKTRFHCNFCSDKSVQTWFGLFQKPIRYETFHFQHRSRAVLFRSRKCFENNVPGVNRSHIQYTLCNAPFHYSVQCEHSLRHALLSTRNSSRWLRSKQKLNKSEVN